MLWDREMWEESMHLFRSFIPCWFFFSENILKWKLHFSESYTLGLHFFHWAALQKLAGQRAPRQLCCKACAAVWHGLHLCWQRLTFGQTRGRACFAFPISVFRAETQAGTSPVCRDSRLLHRIAQATLKNRMFLLRTLSSKDACRGFANTGVKTSSRSCPAMVPGALALPPALVLLAARAVAPLPSLVASTFSQSCLMPSLQPV